MRTTIRFWACLTLLWGAAITYADTLKLSELRCEYMENPSAVQELHPRLSWILESPLPAQNQTAYHVRVADSEAALRKGLGNLWDSGKVDSDQSIHVRYAGTPLTSGRVCHWQVRVWDKDGRPSAWSRPAQWGMGLLQPADWRGVWIGKDEPKELAPIRDAKWIWYPETPAPPATRYFRATLDIPADRVITSARLLAASDNNAEVYLNGIHIARSRNAKATVERQVSDSLKPGRNVWAVSVQNTGDKPNPAGLLMRLEVRFKEGDPLLFATDAAWKAASTAPDGWEHANFDDAAWQPAHVLGAAGIAPWGPVMEPEDRRLPARWLRKEFQVARPVRRAVVHFSGLGLSELHLNGAKIGDDVLSPGLTDYTKRVFYVTHDVTRQLRKGINTLGVVLGNGRYFAPRTMAPINTVTYGFPKVCLQMNLEYADGTREEIVSDETWKMTTAGPILANNEYDGEEYDARKELAGWSRSGYDDSAWETPRKVTAPAGVLTAQPIEPIRVTETRKPVAIHSPKPGVYIVDMGQNMVGWCRIRVKGPAGTEITLRHAETLQPDGTLYLANIRGAKVTDRYILKGQGVETWEPRFTYHGFRFVEVTGWPGKLTPDAIEGRVVHDDLAATGTWSCSHPLLNRIYTNILWGTRGNYRSFPTDCPQRDERQAWLGDRSAESKGEMFFFRTGAFYAKWIQDMVDCQKENGSVSDVAPAYWPLYSDNVTWPASLILVSESLLDQHGDTASIERAYPAMVRWVDYMSGFITNGIMPRDRYGDWCVPPEDPQLIHSQDPARKTEAPILGTTYFFKCVGQLARFATLLGKPADAARFTALADQLKTALYREFFNEQAGYYSNGSQTSCILPLAFDMTPADRRARVLARLIEKITHESKNHVGTGLIGGQWLMRTLSNNGHTDLAYTLATQKTYPSWGYMIEKGATTVWELWNGDTADPAMNSGNHVMLIGDLVIWFYECLAGIQSDPERPGFKHIVMRPQPVGDLRWVQASHRSPYGVIHSAWRIEHGLFRWSVTVPPNATATLHMPNAVRDENVRINGRIPALVAGVRLVRGATHIYEVPAGTYHLEATWKKQ